MTDIAFLKRLDKAFNDIQQADIKGKELKGYVEKLILLCVKYINELKIEEEEQNPLNGSD